MTLTMVDSCVPVYDFWYHVTISSQSYYHSKKNLKEFVSYGEA